MKYLAALLFLVGCATLSAADLSETDADFQIASAHQQGFSLSQEAARPGSSMAVQTFDSDVQAGTRSTQVFSNTHTVSAVRRDGDGAEVSSAVSIPAVLWLFGSILIGLTVIASRKFMSESHQY